MANWLAPGRCPVLVERDDELALVMEMAARAAAGQGSLVLVTGEAGSGKSRLVLEAIASLSDEWRVERAGSDDFVPTLRLETWPQLLVVEDLHERDPSMTAELGELARTAVDTSLLIVATYRLGARGPGTPWAAGAAALLRDPRSTEIRLRPLSPDGVAAMVAALGGRIDAARVGALHERTGGNPFFVEQLAEAEDEALPWTVTESVHAAIAPLSLDARRVAHVLAMVRQPLPIRVLERVGGEAGVPELTTTTLVDVDGDRLSLRHALVVDALEGLQTQSERAELARLLVRELTPDVADEALVVRLLHVAGEREDASKRARALAGALADRQRWRTALDVFRVVLDEAQGDELQRATDLEHAATLAARGGELGAARELARHAADAYARTDESWRAEGVWFNPALRYVGKPSLTAPPMGGSAALLQEAISALGSGDNEEARLLAHRTIEEAAVGRTRSHVADAIAVLASAGDVEAALAMQQRLVDDARSSDNPDVIAAALAEMGSLRRGLGDDAGAIGLFRESVRHAERNPESGIVAHVRAGLAGMLAAFGHIVEAAEIVAPLAHLDHPFLQALYDHVLIQVDTLAGDQASAAARASRLLSPAVLEPDIYAAAVYSTVALQRIVGGEAAEAADLLAKLRDTVLFGFGIRADRLLLETLAADALGDEEMLQRAQVDAADAARAFATPAHQAGAAFTDATIERRRGRHVEAALRFRSAAELYARSPRVAQCCLSWLEAGISFSAAGDAEAAGRALDLADAIAQRHGLRAYIDRSAPVRASLGAPGTPLSALSRRERQIADLVAAGRSNREIGEALFLAEKTVRNRLSDVFTKLGLASRSELAALVGAERNRDT